MRTAAEIVAALGGRWRGRSGMCRCPAHNDKSPSLDITERDGRVLVICRAGCTQEAVMEALAMRGLWASEPPLRNGGERPLRNGQSLTKVPPRGGKTVNDSAAPEHPQLGKRWSPEAERIWSSAQPITGSPVEKYLRSRSAWTGDINDIRATMRHGYPAMLARITDALTNEPLSLHFTLLKADGSGKADVERPKLLLTDHVKKGGVVRLVEDAGVTIGLGIAEGIETTLSVIASGWSPLWCCIDAGNMAEFPVLPGINSLTIFADHDKAGKAAAAKCAARWNTAGREARVVAPLNSGQDWNDVRTAA